MSKHRLKRRGLRPTKVAMTSEERGMACAAVGLVIGWGDFADDIREHHYTQAWDILLKQETELTSDGERMLVVFPRWPLIATEDSLGVLVDRGHESEHLQPAIDVIGSAVARADEKADRQRVRRERVRSGRPA